MGRSLFTDLTKLPSFWLLTSLLIYPTSLEAFYCTTGAPVVIDRLGREALRTAIEKKALKALSDCKQIIISDKKSNDHIHIDLTLEKDIRFPDRETLRCYIDSEKRTNKTISINFKPDLVEKHSADGCAQRLVKVLIEKLIHYVKNSTSEVFSSDLSDNITDLSNGDVSPYHQLEVDVVSSRRRIEQQLTLKKVDLIRNKTLPIADRRQEQAQNAVYSFGQTPRARVTPAKKVAEEDIPYRRLPLDPYKNINAKVVGRRPSITYPNFQTGGPIGTFLTPSLQLPEAQSAGHFEISTTTTFVQYHFQDQAGSFSNLNWGGSTTKQTITLASRLWNRLHISILSGVGGHSGEFNLEADLAHAKGGTTFLRHGSTERGLLDTQLNLHTVVEYGRFVARPHLSIKFPTADPQQSLGNGGIDTGFGLSLEAENYDWTIKGQITYTQPADLDIFEHGQEALPAKNYIYLGLGAGRQLWSEHAQIAFAVHWMSNPLSGSTELDPLQQAASSAAIQMSHNIRSSQVSVEASRGITSSSIKNSFGVKLEVWF